MYIIFIDFFESILIIAFLFMIPLKAFFYNAYMSDIIKYKLDSDTQFLPPILTILLNIFMVLIMGLKFFRCYYDKGISINDRFMIAINYLKTYFIGDTIVLIIMFIQIFDYNERLRWLSFIFYIKIINLYNYDQFFKRVL